MKKASIGKRGKKSLADYDDPSFSYKRYWQKRQYEHLAEKLVLKKFFELIPQKESLADIGGGFGRLVPVYASAFKKCTLVDPSKRLLETAKKFTKKYPQLKVIEGLANRLPLKDKSLDVALIIRAVHHFLSPDIAFKEVNRILKPNGYFILEFANKLHFKACLRAISRLNFSYFTDLAPAEKSEEIIFSNFHPQKIKKLLVKNGFQLVKIIPVSNFRSAFLKRIFPLKILLFLENIAQKNLPPCASGPSVFILAQKT